MLFRQSNFSRPIHCLRSRMSIKGGAPKGKQDPAHCIANECTYPMTCVCDLIASSVGKRNVELPLIRSKKDTVACAQCCNTQPVSSGVPCNRVLCDQQASSVPNDTCGVCDHVSRPSDCTVFQSCQPNEVCKANTVFGGGRVIYELGCELKTVCDAFLREYEATHHGKRADHGDLVLCSACCTGKNCNTKGDCKTLIQNQTCFNSAICG